MTESSQAAVSETRLIERFHFRLTLHINQRYPPMTKSLHLISIESFYVLVTLKQLPENIEIILL